MFLLKSGTEHTSLLHTRTSVYAVQAGGALTCCASRGLPVTKCHSWRAFQAGWEERAASSLCAPELCQEDLGSTSHGCVGGVQPLASGILPLCRRAQRCMPARTSGAQALRACDSASCSVQPAAQRCWITLRTCHLVL